MSTYVDLSESDSERAASEISNLSKESRTIVLNAANDVRILISYISRRHGDKILELTEHLDTAVSDNLIAGKFDRADEIKLWNQLAHLSAVAAPATPESIRESRYYKVIFGEFGRRSKSTLLVWIRVAAVVLFVITFMLGAYVQLTNDALDNLVVATTERDKVIRGEYDGTRLAGMTKTGTPTSAEETNSPAATHPDSPVMAHPNSSTALNPSPNSPDEDFVRNVEDSPSNRDGPDSVALKAAKLGIQQEIQGAYALLSPIFWATGQNISEGTIDGADGETYTVYNSMVISVQKSINKFILDYFIPMIASFLGVAVFIIRDTTMRLESVSLSPMAEDGYWPRIILGLIAGLTIGWLTPSVEQLSTIATHDGTTVLTTGVSNTFATLSKTALAFVVGYSIEVLFNILDAIKAALGVRDEDR
ncbi:hypothetical protein NKJ40_07145 [Mesorhizobium sp. M0119]|uniref:hypothetical protein n=1 Tax=Mesorhizobium sp. M0119 TaxID=2956885 RepID=UPI0033352739